MPDNRRIKKLAGTIGTLYRNHWGLFWRIMMPVVVIAIVWDIAVFFYSIPRFEKDINDSRSGNVYTITSNINTVSGIHLTVADTSENFSTNTRSALGMDWKLYPAPYFSITNTERITWKWELNLRIFENTPLILLLLTFCPLSLAVARISRSPQIHDVAKRPVSLTARDVWRQIGRKAFLVFAASLLFVLILNIGGYLYILVTLLIPSLVWILFPYMIFTLIMVPYVYFFLTLSLYNPCLILENNSIIGVFRRSYALVRGVKLRFLGIYLLTGWVASIMTSVLLGIVLLVFSVFVPDLAQVRDALSPLKFLSLFIGGDIEIVLPQLLSVPATVMLLIVRGLITTLLVPIWAILTTLLYLERIRIRPATVTEVV